VTLLGSDFTLPEPTPAGYVIVGDTASLPAINSLLGAIGDTPDHFGWVACDNRTTRAVAKIFREDYKIPRKAVKAQAYWAA